MFFGYVRNFNAFYRFQGSCFAGFDLLRQFVILLALTSYFFLFLSFDLDFIDLVTLNLWFKTFHDNNFVFTKKLFLNF